MYLRAPMTQWKTFYLPGRVRMEIPGLKGHAQVGFQLESYLHRIKGIESVQANFRTGRILIIYQPQEFTFPQVEKLVLYGLEAGKKHGYPTVKTSPPPAINKIYKKQLRNLLLTSLAITLLIAKRALRGKGWGASSHTLLSLSSLLTILAGYPLLRKGIERFTKKGEVINYPLILGTAGFFLAVARESLPGLVVLWLTHFSELLKIINLTKTENQIAERVKNYQARTWVVVNETEVQLPLDSLVRGMIVSLGEGELIPVDGDRKSVV